MPQPNRAQRRDAARRRATGSSVLKITVGESEYLFDVERSMDEISARDAAHVRQVLGVSLRALLQSATDDPDIDVLAVMVWLARRPGEPELSIESVLGEISYGTSIDVVTGDDLPEPPEADDPET